ncbi:MAG TPA: heavy metal translocating P-type ATPase [Vicinamibacterales bacterium]|nr:heavy metal translocating P-type ATPase [Vicinamibacterales bacterium]
MKSDAVIAAASAIGIAVHLIVRFLVPAAWLPAGAADWPLWCVLVAGGGPLLVTLARSLVRGRLGADWLAGISIVTAALLGEYLVGAIVVLMLSGGAALEAYATRRASHVLEALAQRVPQVAHRIEAGRVTDISLIDIRAGDELRIMPHEVCPVDGEVTQGRTTMDESYLTGEPFVTQKTPGSTVLSGAINGEQAIAIRATHRAEDSRYARIMRVMQEAEQQRPALRRLADRLGAWYTPAALAVGLSAWAASGQPGRFLAVMVIATPCPLLIAIPVAIIGAISLAARRGIIIRNPAALEEVGRCRTLVLDKTGTLTYGRPTLSQIVPASPWTASTLLPLVASLEQYSRHPLAGAVLRRAEQDRAVLGDVSEVSERPGLGLSGRVGGHHVLVTGRQAPIALAAVQDLPPVVPGLEALVFIGDRFAGALRFHDEPRQDSQPFIAHLGPRHSFARTLLLSGDREAEVRYLAQHVGIRDVHAEASPEDKVAIVRRETAAAPTMFVGDGINDAPAMQAATVGVAFGHQNDITSEAADAVILEPSLVKLDEFLHIAVRMRRVALQSAVGGMALSVGGMAAAATGLLPPIWGAIAQEGIDLAAVLNALRVAMLPREVADVPVRPA